MFIGPTSAKTFDLLSFRCLAKSDGPHICKHESALHFGVSRSPQHPIKTQIKYNKQHVCFCFPDFFALPYQKVENAPSPPTPHSLAGLRFPPPDRSKRVFLKSDDKTTNSNVQIKANYKTETHGYPCVIHGSTWLIGYLWFLPFMTV